jgi:CheY-like chemotaxis protein
MNEDQPATNGRVDDSRKLVFAVDDEPMLLELISLVLEPLGYRVRVFRDPATALRAFALTKPPPALVVTDYAMHTMTGMDLIRECRRINPNQKIILVSGTVDEAIYRNSETKPDEFLAKPYQAKELSDLVRDVIAA